MSYVGTNSTATSAASSSEKIGQCDVHALLDGDQRPRKVRYCSLCEAWLCDDCRKNPVRRARAAMKKRGW